MCQWNKIRYTGVPSYSRTALFDYRSRRVNAIAQLDTLLYFDSEQLLLVPKRATPAPGLFGHLGKTQGDDASFGTAVSAFRDVNNIFRYSRLIIFATICCSFSGTAAVRLCQWPREQLPVAKFNRTDPDSHQKSHFCNVSFMTTKGWENGV